jgi:hypothetical protein
VDLFIYLFIYLFIRVMELSNNCSSLAVMSAIPYLDYFFHLSMEISWCVRVQGMHVLHRVQIVTN